LVAEEGVFNEGADGCLFFGAYLADCSEVVVEAVGDGAFCFFEDERIWADGEGDGESSKDAEGGLAGAALVAAQLGDVDADPVGERRFSERPLSAEGGEAGSEGHGAQVDGCEQRTILLRGP
jgi:hypothetical protein